jgi:hypothetical protein
MSPSKPPEPQMQTNNRTANKVAQDDRERSKRFLEAAKEAGADETIHGVINDPYPTTLSPAFGVPLSLVLNFGAPVVAYLFSLRLKRHRWWPHVVVCLWEIISIAISGILLFPKIPSDEAPGPGDGLLLIPTLLSVAVILFGYCIALLWKFLSFIFTPE